MYFRQNPQVISPPVHLTFAPAPVEQNHCRDCRDFSPTEEGEKGLCDRTATSRWVHPRQKACKMYVEAAAVRPST